MIFQSANSNPIHFTLSPSPSFPPTFDPLSQPPCPFSLLSTLTAGKGSTQTSCLESRQTVDMQVQSQPLPNSALEHWVNSGEEQQQHQIEPTPPSPLTQVGYDGSDRSTGGGSSSGHHSHEHSLEHGLVLPHPPSHQPSSNLSLAFQSSPRSFDFRNSGSQPSSLRTSFSSFGTTDEALDSLRRSSYSTTSDIRGTLEETRLDGDRHHQPAEQWAMNGESYVSPLS